MSAFESDSAALAPARDASALQALSFAQLVGLAERFGVNQGHAQVIALYRGWIAAKSDEYDEHLYAAWFNYAVELSCSGDADGAIRAYRASLSLRPDFSSAAVNLGLLLERSGDPDGALLAWMRATQCDDARTALLNQQARLLERRGQFDEAERLMRASLMTVPEQPDVIQHWIHIRQKMCAWPVLSGHSLPLSSDTLMENCGPLAALALSDDIAAQRRVGAAWIARKTTPTNAHLCPPEGYRHAKLRVGYISSDFCRHAMSFLIAGLFETHDRSRFEIYGYCSSIDDNSDIRRRVVGAFDVCRPIRAMPDEQAARLIRDDEIDILIDLNGLTQGSRLQVLRWRPAPVQATYLGFVGPVPLPELDYLLCDDVVVPPAIAPSYAPEPLYIGPTYQANDSKREVGAAIGRVQAGLPQTGFVFCCFSNHYKITPQVFGAWMQILKQVEGSWLWLVADNQWSCRALRAHAETAGVDPARLLFADRVDPAAYMARLQVGDLFLDTFPYNAGTVASDAIRMGLPLLTLSGEAFASRMATRLLAAIGADDGIAATLNDYIGSAVKLATDSAAYEGYKACFSGARWAGTIGDIGPFTRSLEDTLCRIAKRAPV